MYSHISPKVPRRPNSARVGGSPIGVPLMTVPSTLVTRSLELELEAESFLTLPPRALKSSSDASLGEWKHRAINDGAKSIFGALANEYGGFDKVPPESLEVAIRVTGITSLAEIAALKREIEDEHHRHELREQEILEEVRSKSLDSIEKKRALLENRLKYHLMLPLEPSQPDVQSQRSVIRSYIRGEIKAVGSRGNSPCSSPSPPLGSSSARGQDSKPRRVSPLSEEEISSGARDSPRSRIPSPLRNGQRRVERQVDSPAKRTLPTLQELKRGLSSRPVTASARGDSHIAVSTPRNSRTANSDAKAQGPATTSAASFRREVSTVTAHNSTSKNTQLDILNIRRVLNEVQMKLPLLQRIQAHKKIDTATIEGQIQCFIEIFILIDTDGSGEIDADEFIAFGKRIGGECSRLFSRKMHNLVRKMCMQLQQLSPPPPLSSTSTSGGFSPRNEGNLQATASTVSYTFSASPGVGGGITKEGFLRVLFPEAQPILNKILFGIPIEKSNKRTNTAAPASNVVALPGTGASGSAAPVKWEDTWGKDELSLLLAMFNGADTDRDGLVSAEDLLLFSTKNLKERPADHEVAASLALFKDQVMLFDADHDGMVSLEEFARMQRAVFDFQKRQEEAHQPLLYNEVKTGW